MFFISFIIAFLVLLMFNMSVLSFSIANTIAMLRSCFVWGGIPIFILIVLSVIILIKSIFMIDKKKFDLPPKKVIIRLFRNLLLLIAVTIIIVFIDRIVETLIFGRSFNCFTSPALLRRFIFSANFFLPLNFAVFTYFFCFIFYRSEFLQTIPHRMISIIFLVFLLAGISVIRWDISSNCIECILDPTKKANYFVKHHNLVPKGRLRSLYALRAGQFLSQSGIENDDSNKVLESLSFLDKVGSEYNTSTDFYNTKLDSDIFMRNENDILEGYKNFLSKMPKVRLSFLKRFTNDLLLFEKPPFTEIISVLSENIDTVRNDVELLKDLNFLKNNLEEDTEGLEKFFAAKNDAIASRRRILEEIIEDNRDFLIKDDAYFLYLDALTELGEKRFAHIKLIEFLRLFPDSPYIVDIADLKERIKYTQIVEKDLPSDDMFNFSKFIDDKFYIFSGSRLYEFNSNNMTLSRVFVYTNDGPIISNVINADKYFWLFYKGGAVDIINLINREKRQIIAPIGDLSYTSPALFFENRMYVGTLAGISIHTPEGKKMESISRLEGLSSAKIYSLNRFRNDLYIGTDMSFAIHETKNKKTSLERGYRDPVSNQNFSFFRFVKEINNNVISLTDLGLIRFSKNSLSWDNPIIRERTGLFDHNDKILALITFTRERSKLNIFDLKTGEIRKEITDILLGEPFTKLKILENSIYISNAEKKVIKIALDTYNMQEFSGDITGGDILHLDIHNDYLIVIQPRKITFVDLLVK